MIRKPHLISTVALQWGATASGVTILGWHHIMMWNHNSTDLWWIFCLTFLFSLCLFVPYPHLDRKPTHFAAKTFLFFCLVFTYFWTENPLILRRIPFFLVFTYFWTEKGCHHEIQPRAPPSLATPLDFYNKKVYIKKSLSSLIDSV